MLRQSTISYCPSCVGLRFGLALGLHRPSKLGKIRPTTTVHLDTGPNITRRVSILEWFFDGKYPGKTHWLLVQFPGTVSS